MASKTGAVWAVDIGSSSLKALHVRETATGVEVIGFDNIAHGKILSGSGIQSAERDELIAISLRKFVEKNDIGHDDVIISVASQSSFARFVNLPPVEKKRIPEIIKFEASQQIPFDMNEVQWDWQLMEDEGAERKVGIFAIKNEVVNAELEYFAGERVQITGVQMAPMALYNYVLYDRPDLTRKNNEATIILNIGAENTDLVICTANSVWQRCITMGGNAFTRAIADAFKLNFDKAEKLKRTAPMSKYARQILQAMKPVFTDLASEIQRSLGFYTSSNAETKLTRVIALGGGTKMRGLLKYLQQSLQIPIERPDMFKKLSIGSDVSAAKFHDSVCDFGVVYGLCLQSLGLARIDSNLLPRSMARSIAWAGKAKYFIAAASLILLVSVMALGRTLLDRTKYKENTNTRLQIKRVIIEAEASERKLSAEKNKEPIAKAQIVKEFKLFENRNVIPLLHEKIISCLPNEKNNSEQKEIYEAFAKSDVEGLSKVPRKERKQIFVTSMSINFADDIEMAGFSTADFRSGTARKAKGKKDETEEIDLFDMESMRHGGGQVDYKFKQQGYTKKKTKGDTVKPAEEDEGGSGFVVTVAGYSPYEKIAELMDPAGAEGDKNKWGFITRLMHFDKVFDSNCPFKLYKKLKVEHFNLEVEEVDIESGVPLGVGVEEVRFNKGQNAELGNIGEKVLVDPMTGEVISKVAIIDEDGREKTDRSGEIMYEVNDHWFILNVKFVWKNAPKMQEEAKPSRNRRKRGDY